MEQINVIKQVFNFFKLIDLVIKNTIIVRSHDLNLVDQRLPKLTIRFVHKFQRKPIQQLQIKWCPIQLNRSLLKEVLQLFGGLFHTSINLFHVKMNNISSVKRELGTF